ncbi:hypothetical protein B1812_14150 [Methylocystis bryophila]|uniref:Arylsulfotransferase N-terminal domain-containing protein n=1 Tax=Methylocystis bryophila TaxID=655015 RepID=A0A1W6N1B2_9HYPH|nr:hypothetical protein B1812_14150 [Methylocystis bryophila]
MTQSPQVWSFQSAPQLHPMKVQVNKNDPSTYSGLIFLGPYAYSDNAEYGQPGSLILDNSGNPVWFRPLSSPNLMNTDFRVQQFNGRPVLTFWQGTLATPPAYTNVPAGSSEPGSCYYILDNTYNVIRTVTAQKGYTSDVHEFLLTPNNTALLLSTLAVPMDLTAYGGPKNGYVQDFAIQEIDPSTNQLLFFWSALQHIPLSDSYEPASSATSSGNIWDAYHLNSVGLTDSANDILVSGRNTFTIYRVNKPTGNILWRLGGKQNNFVIVGADAQFSWQHDARFHLGSGGQNNVVSMFDDNCCESQTVPPGTPASHGLFLNINSSTMTASLQRQFYLSSSLHVASQGSVQTLPNSNVFIGWGQSAYYSEFAPLGNTADNPSVNLLYYAQMPDDNYSYRAYHDNWVGTPSYPPSAVAISSSGQTTVYASWNGSTETRTWQVFNFVGLLVPPVLIKTATKTGFETAIPVTATTPYFQVKALNGQGQVIGTSSVITLIRR